MAPEPDRAIAPLVQRIEQEQAKLDSLPPNADLKTRFASVYVLDQYPRQFMGEVLRSELSAEDMAKARGEASAIMAEQDAKNLQIVLEHLPPEGWYLHSRYGVEVATTAFLVVQHSNLETWRRFVPVLEPLVAAGEVDGQSYGLMYDRLALAEKRPQRYGSQLACQNGEWVVLNLEAPEAVDDRRREMGFTESHADYVAGFKSMPC
ncbi:hypothetical protein GCM10009093_26370 [Brevundimonas terrae]|uniref:Uncharacterized protein n=1 Tax=Brevundimonas terrae TaxID=363631 RepID=A0ABP3IEC2_9CAUL|nr:DUF6624 domain-containing protein [Brevundimonas terrae]NIJ27397.1 hypothetical protein [Brevundimonas terrae]